MSCRVLLIGMLSLISLRDDHNNSLHYRKCCKVTKNASYLSRPDMKHFHTKTTSEYNKFEKKNAERKFETKKITKLP